MSEIATFGPSTIIRLAASETTSNVPAADCYLIIFVPFSVDSSLMLIFVTQPSKGLEWGVVVA